MRTRLLLRRPDGVTDPVVLGVDAVTTVGEVADTLVQADDLIHLALPSAAVDGVDARLQRGPSDA